MVGQSKVGRCCYKVVKLLPSIVYDGVFIFNLVLGTGHWVLGGFGAIGVAFRFFF